MQKIKFKHKKEIQGEVSSSMLNSGRAKKVFNWKSEVNLEDGIKKTINWLKKKVC